MYRDSAVHANHDCNDALVSLSTADCDCRRLIALPILIHLINLMRHRRVQWAAMEFLLVSQKRNSTWMMLKQLLAALAADGGRGGGRDDGGAADRAKQVGRRCSAAASCTTSCCWTTASRCPTAGPTPRLRRSQEVIQRLGTHGPSSQRGRNLRCCDFRRPRSNSPGTQFDLTNETIDAGEFPKKIDQTLQRLHTSQLAVGPEEALKAAVQLIGDGSDVKSIVFLVSDFRTKDWGHAAETRKTLQKLNEVGAKVQLINCVSASQL